MRRGVLVLAGGESDEHDVSVASGADVAAALAAQCTVVEVHIDRAGGWHVGDPDAPALPIDDVLSEVPDDVVVFPVLHGGWGEGGGLQRELEERGIRYVGCDSASSARAQSKLDTARICAAAGVAAVPTRRVDRARHVADPDLLAGAIARVADGAIVVKPDAGGSSIGVHVVPAGRSPRPALDDVFRRDATALVQPFVAGQEVSVGVWTDAGGDVHVSGASLLHLPAGDAGDGFTYAHKYEGGGAVLEIPARLPGDVLARLRRDALRCFTALGCRGLARIDFFVLPGGGIVLNEVNTMPGLRRTSHFPRLVAAAGTSYEALLESLVAVAARLVPHAASAVP